MAGSKKVEPIRLDARRRVEPAGEFSFEDENEELFAIWAQEQVTAEGTTIDYWVHGKSPEDGTEIDPLYGEPIVRGWLGPYRIKVYAEWPEQDFETREEGASISWPATVWIPRLTVEDANMEKYPSEGDVLRLWPIPYFDSFAQGVDSDIPGAGYYFDVIGVTEDGHTLDNAEFTGFKLSVKRRTTFTPERRLMNET